MPTRAAALALLTVMLSGCAGHVKGVLVPTATDPPGTDKVDMLVVTTRAASAVVGEGFSGERGTGVSFNQVLVSIPRNRAVGEIQWPTSLPADPLRSFALVREDPIDLGHIRSWFARAGARGHKLLVFVHGYNTTYEEAVFRFAQIAHDTGTRAAPVLFTWPSRGQTLQYGYDLDSATVSRDALEQLLTRASADPQVTDVTLIAHSMGNWLAMEALRQMAIRRGRIDPKIKNVILASADLDVDVFRSEFADIPSPRPRFTLLVSRDDKALRLSQTLSGNVDRLGLIDPGTESYRTRLAEAGLSVVDLTKVEGRGDLNHTKFADSPEIVRLIGNRLIEGQAIEVGDAGDLGGSLSAAMSNAATTVRTTVARTLAQ